MIKCNHGCKWHYIIKNKNEFLNNKQLFEQVKKQMTGWLEQNFCWWGGFELQYLNIKPKILIEPLLREKLYIQSEEINIYCFAGEVEFIIKQFINGENIISYYDKHCNSIEPIFNTIEKIIYKNADNNIRQTIALSKSLSKKFDFVRVDWMIYQNKIYFTELTFTPYSGFQTFKNKKINIQFGNLINLKGVNS